MKRKIFLGSFWLLLAFGTLQVIADVISWQEYYTIPVIRQSGMLLRLAMRLFMWPAIIFAEVLIYWLIRRRNRYHALSWAHAGILIAAFLILAFASAFLIPHRGIRDTESRIDDRIYRQELQYFFWAMVAIAHIAFLAVLANCARKDEPVTSPAGTENLLDDIEI
ncbi:MAG TPA: hypothetical protein VN616_13745 [Puia sp.]|nr:hypothetical protein [Puia sp.]